MRIQTGYERIVPCELLRTGKVAVCDFDRERLDESDDGAQWSRMFRCEVCGFELSDDLLNLGEDKQGNDMLISDIKCIPADEVTAELLMKHGQRVPKAVVEED